MFAKATSLLTCPEYRSIGVLQNQQLGSPTHNRESVHYSTDVLLQQVQLCRHICWQQHSAVDLNVTFKSTLQNRDRMEHEQGIMLIIMFGNVVDMLSTSGKSEAMNPASIFRCFLSKRTACFSLLFMCILKEEAPLPGGYPPG